MYLIIDNTKTESNIASFKVEDIPQHLVPNKQMTENFIQNCKDLGMWD
jgi:hypothetical protein